MRASRAREDRDQCARPCRRACAPRAGNSIASLISAVKASSSSSFASGGLSSLKATIAPSYAAAPGAEAGFSPQFKVVLLGVAGWVLYRADQQARSKDWIVDLSLDVLQAAWWISYASFLPFRSVYLSLRGIAPSSAAPLSALKPASFIK